MFCLLLSPHCAAICLQHLRSGAGKVYHWPIGLPTHLICSVLFCIAFIFFYFLLMLPWPQRSLQNDLFVGGVVDLEMLAFCLSLSDHLCLIVPLFLCVKHYGLTHCPQLPLTRSEDISTWTAVADTQLPAQVFVCCCLLSGQCTITCKSCAQHQAIIACNMMFTTWYGQLTY